MYIHPQDKKRTELLNSVLARMPPRLHRWFLGRWAEPAAWHAARLAFTRTAAVMSMVGHICGLGDRHGGSCGGVYTSAVTAESAVGKVSA